MEFLPLAINVRLFSDGAKESQTELKPVAAINPPTIVFVPPALIKFLRSSTTGTKKLVLLAQQSYREMDVLLAVSAAKIRDRLLE